MIQEALAKPPATLRLTACVAGCFVKLNVPPPTVGKHDAPAYAPSFSARHHAAPKTTSRTVAQNRALVYPPPFF